eukprot:354728-Chlamydomonas_euryale.AAC.15
MAVAVPMAVRLPASPMVPWHGAISIHAPIGAAVHAPATTPAAARKVLIQPLLRLRRQIVKACLEAHTCFK